MRWKIENEGFNTQKNGGYALEHLFCLDSVGMKNFYLLLQIAHIINQLLEYGLLGGKEKIYKVFGSIRNIAATLLWPGILFIDFDSSHLVNFFL